MMSNKCLECKHLNKSLDDYPCNECLQAVINYIDHFERDEECLVIAKKDDKNDPVRI